MSIDPLSAANGQSSPSLIPPLSLLRNPMPITRMGKEKTRLTMKTFLALLVAALIYASFNCVVTHRKRENVQVKKKRNQAAATKKRAVARSCVVDRKDVVDERRGMIDTSKPCGFLSQTRKLDPALPL